MEHWNQVSNRTKAVMLASFVKLSVQSQDVADKFRELVEKFKTSLDLELQQRAVEYLNILDSSIVSEDQLDTVMDVMPPFSEDKTSNLVVAIQKKEKNKNVIVPLP